MAVGFIFYSADGGMLRTGNCFVNIKKTTNQNKSNKVLVCVQNTKNFTARGDSDVFFKFHKTVSEQKINLQKLS